MQLKVEKVESRRNALPAFVDGMESVRKGKGKGKEKRQSHLVKQILKAQKENPKQNL